MRAWLLGIIAAILSGLLAAAAFPPFEISGLIWVALMPLLYLLTRSRPWPALVHTFLFCLVFHTGLFSWMFQLSGYTLLHHLILGLVLSVWLGSATLAINLVSRRYGPLVALVSAPFAWVVYEWLRSNVGFLSLPWGLLAHSQYTHASLIQSAAITGTWGLSALIVAVNSALTALFYPAFVKLSPPALLPIPLPAQKKTTWFFLMAAFLFVANLGYGHWILRHPFGSRTLRVAAVQGNIEQHEKWDDTKRAEIMTIYADLSLTTGKRRPDLMIWPETATPRSVAFDPQTYRYVKNIVDRTGANLLLGSSQVQKFKHGKAGSARLFNSAFLITPGKNLVQQRYDKVKLLPFAEYLPLESTLPWHWLQVPDLTHYVPGSRAHVFFTKDFRFAAPICWENIFPRLARRFVRNGAQFIVNITNEAWFGRSAAPYHFLAMNVFRAVENRRTVVRCANTGISCIIDPHGKIIDRLRAGDGRDIFVRGVLHGGVRLNEALSVFTRWGDWFVGLSLAIWILLLAICHYLRLRSHAEN